MTLEIDVILAGGCSGSISWLAIYPLDVLKSNVQARLEYGINARTCAKEILRQFGAKGLYKGVAISVLRAFPVNAAIFLCIRNHTRLFVAEILAIKLG